MSERDNAKESKKLFELFGKAVDARNQHILESSPDQGDYYPKLKMLEQEMWTAHSRWHVSVLSAHLAER
jgi:hypothetical protein